MLQFATEPDAYPDFSGEADPGSELTPLHRSLLRRVVVEIPREKPKKKGSRSRPKRGHKKPAPKKKSDHKR